MSEGRLGLSPTLYIEGHRFHRLVSAMRRANRDKMMEERQHLYSLDESASLLALIVDDTWYS